MNGGLLVCPKRGTPSHLSIVDITAPKMKEVEGSVEGTITSVEASPISNFFVVQTDRGLSICYTDGTSFRVVTTLDKSSAHAMTPQHIAVHEKSGLVTVLDTKTGRLISKTQLT